MSSSATPDFAARIAQRYDALRAGDDYHYLTDRLVAAGDLAQRRVLDIGCGTGMFAADLAQRHGGIVWGVDQSPEMLAVAEERANARVRFERAAAERLPFADGSFERATMVSVAHHLDRPRAFAEARRVLSPVGRLAIANADPEGFGEMWLMRWFPELLDRELARFPGSDDLGEELTAAGFEAVEVNRVAVPRRLEREQALEKIRGRHISSFDLLADEQYRSGLARAERELPAEGVAYTLRSLLVVAVRPAR